MNADKENEAEKLLEEAVIKHEIKYGKTPENRVVLDEEKYNQALALLRKPECRKCSECKTNDHHWIDTCDKEGNPIKICKHCEIKQEPSCPTCGGSKKAPADDDGNIVGPDDDVDRIVGVVPCPDCRPEPSEFTKMVRLNMDNWQSVISKAASDVRLRSLFEWLKESLAIIDTLTAEVENDYKAFESIMDNILEPDKITCLVEPRKHKIRQALKGE